MNPDRIMGTVYFSRVVRLGFLSSFILLLVFFSGLLSCGGKAGDRPKEIRIGAIFALTGATSETCVMYAAGVEDSFRQATEEGGIGGLPVRLIQKDSHYLLSRAISGYKAMRKSDPILALMSWGTGETEALSPLVRMDRICCLSGSLSHTLSDPKEMEFNFIGGATYEDQFLGACRHILERFGNRSAKPRVVLIYSDTAFGRAPFFPDGIVKASEMGIEIVDHMVVELDETDATLQLSDVRELNPDYVIVQQTVAATAVLLRDARKIGLFAPMIGLGWALDESLSEAAGDAAEGFLGVVTHPIWLEENRQAADRIRALAKGYGRPAPMVGKSYIIGYCNGRILLHALSQCAQDLTGICVRDKLEEIRELKLPAAGITLSYDSTRHDPATPVWVFQIKEKAIVPVGGPYRP